MKYETAFHRVAPAIAVFHTALMVIPVGFLWIVMDGGSPVTRDLYGELVYSIPALVWIGVQIVVTTIAATGAWLEMPTLSAVGSLMMFSLMAFFSSAAIMAGADGTLLVFGAAALAIVALLCAGVAWWGRNGRAG
jgi:hypothetical protein